MTPSGPANVRGPVQRILPAFASALGSDSTFGPASTTTTERPRAASVAAATAPHGPAPTTTTSADFGATGLPLPLAPRRRLPRLHLGQALAVLVVQPRLLVHRLERLAVDEHAEHLRR